MIILFGGFFMIVSAYLYRWTREATRSIRGEKPQDPGFEFLGTAGLGVFLMFIGFTVIFANLGEAQVDKFQLLMLFSLVSSLNVQARLLNIIERERNLETLSLMDNSNGVKAVKLAYSIGIFPADGRCLFLIHICQVIQAASLIFVVFV